MSIDPKIGLKAGTVVLSDHQKEWEIEACKTISILKNILGSIIKDIQHVGSTSIPSIKAKPIIDIAIEIDDLDNILKYKEKLEINGFYYRDKCQLKNQRLFACGDHYNGLGNTQTHYIHVFQANSQEWINTINFRDYLRQNISVAKQYEALKIDLAQKFANCPKRDEYINGKNDFIKSVCRDALFYSFLGKIVNVKIDRPMGSLHPKFKDIIYKVNYGFIPNTTSGDDEEIDVYLLGVDHPVSDFQARVIAIIHRLNDVEDKLVAAPEGITFSKSEIESAVNFQEKYFKTEIKVLNSSI